MCCTGCSGCCCSGLLCCCRDSSHIDTQAALRHVLHQLRTTAVVDLHCTGQHGPTRIAFLNPCRCSCSCSCRCRRCCIRTATGGQRRAGVAVRVAPRPLRWLLCACSATGTRGRWRYWHVCTAASPTADAAASAVICWGLWLCWGICGSSCKCCCQAADRPLF